MRSELASPTISLGYRVAMAVSSVPCSFAEEEGGAEDRDLLSRLPFGGLRRKAASESQDTSIMSSAPARCRSFSQDFGNAAVETYLLTSRTLVLLRYLGVGYRWMTRLLALACYAILLMPGFLQVAYYYLFSSQVRLSVVYGNLPRNRLDLYLPVDSNDSKPVMVFVTGGAWIIGYKAWGSLLGRRLAERGIIVASIDYRNFPQGTISDMIRDVSQGISFICNNIASYGGDPNRIFLMGQSAGAHIAACSLLHQAIKECKEDSISWSVSQIKAFFGLSGGYNMLNLVDHFHSRGLYRSIFLSIMEGEQSLKCFSPEVVVMDLSTQQAIQLLPSFVLYHGTSDYSMPSNASLTFAEALHSVGVQARVVLYEGKTHMDLFIHDPLRGGRDELLEDIVSVIHSDNAATVAKDAVAPPAPRLTPELLLQLACKISLF